MPLRISVAGLVEIDVDGARVEMDRLGRIGRLFWVYLVCERRRPVAKDELAEVLWGQDDLPRSWDQMLRGNASKLRTVLASAGLDPAAALSSAFGAYQVRLPPDAVVDVEEAESNVEAAVVALDAGDVEAAYDASSAAVRVVARGFLPGSSGIWVERRQAELRELHLRALEQLARAAVAGARWGDAVSAAEEAVALQPFRESAHQMLMAAHKGAGNPAEALRAYERCRRVLAEELGASPSAATESVYLSLLADELAPDTAESRLPLPPPLAPTAVSFLVGRTTESDRLGGALERASSDGRQAVLVAGEPGIGKTSLVAEFARDAHAGGARVLYGRCDEDPGVAYQPFAEALGHYVRHAPRGELEAHVAVHGSEVARVAPELLRRLPEQPPPVTGSDGNRYRLFEAISELITGAAQRGSLVLVLDDLHWAAPPTLALLRHVLRARAAALVVVGTYRHTEVGPDHPLASTLADLWREPGIERLLLEGLEEDGVTAFVERSEGHTLDRAGHDLARALHVRTAGNPFFVGEFLRHLSETGAVYRREGTWSYYEDSENLGVPEGVRDVLGRRLTRLSEAANRVLTLASVVGTEFDLRLLEMLGEQAGAGTTLDALDEAVGAQVVAELGTGHYRFAHALVRDTVYSALTATRKARLHHQVGRALASLPGDDDVRLPSLAHHFTQAAADGAATQAGEYSLAAARQAFDKSAWEDVLTFVTFGIGALSPDDVTHLALRFELLLLRYETFMVLAIFPPGIDALLAAVETARLLGSPETVARAASIYLLTSRPEPGVVALAEEALRRLGGSAPDMRARLLAGLAVSARDDPGKAEATAGAALALARESGDSDAVHTALVAHKLLLADSPRARERLAVEEELVAIGPRTGPVAGGSRWIHSLGRGRALARLTLGDRDGFEADAGRLAAWTGELQNRGGRWQDLLWRATLALLDGRFSEVETLASAGPSLVPAHLEPWAVQMCKLALEEGRAAAFAEEATRVLTAAPGNTALHAMVAVTHCETGRHEDALRILDELAADDFRRVLRVLTTTAFAYVTEVVVALEEADRAARVYELFVPYSGLTCVSGFGAHCPGAVDRYLGQLASILGRWDQAECHYQAALELEIGLRSPPLLARTRYWFGRMLVERNRLGDADRARALLNAAVETAGLLGMKRLEAQAAEL